MIRRWLFRRAVRRWYAKRARWRLLSHLIVAVRTHMLETNALTPRLGPTTAPSTHDRLRWFLAYRTEEFRRLDEELRDANLARILKRSPLFKSETT